MNRIKLLVVVALAAAALTLSGCVKNPYEAEKSDKPEVWGYVASADSAQLELAETQMGVDTLVVDRVLAPQDAWVVVHLDDNGKPGMRVGLQHIDKGESTNVKVKLDKVTSNKLIVAVHSDRAENGKFDFDMMNPTMSADRPYFVNEKELAKVVTVREFGVKVGTGEASIEASPQPSFEGTLTVNSVTAPTDAWVVVHLEKDGAPGDRVGLVHVPAGTTEGVEVPIAPVPLSDNLLVAVHADRGQAGLFEFDMMDKINSSDQPFFVGGKEVAIPVQVK